MSPHRSPLFFRAVERDLVQTTRSAFTLLQHENNTSLNDICFRGIDQGYLSFALCVVPDPD